MNFELDYFLIWSLLALLPVIIFPMFVGCGQSTLKVTVPVNAEPITVRIDIAGVISLVDILARHEASIIATTEELTAIEELRNTLRIGISDPGVQTTNFSLNITISVVSTDGTLTSETITETRQIELTPLFGNGARIDDWITTNFNNIPVVTLRRLSNLLNSNPYSLRISINSDLLLQQQTIRIPFIDGSSVFTTSATSGSSLSAGFLVIDPANSTDGANLVAASDFLTNLEN